MKISLLVLAITMFTSCTSFAEKPATTDACCKKNPTEATATDSLEKKTTLSGGYTQPRELNADEKSLFTKMTSGLKGAIYTPTNIATQIVAGVNYRFVCQATPTAPDPMSYEVEIIVYQPLPAQGEARITSLKRL